MRHKIDMGGCEDFVFGNGRFKGIGIRGVRTKGARAKGGHNIPIN